MDKILKGIRLIAKKQTFQMDTASGKRLDVYEDYDPLNGYNLEIVDQKGKHYEDDEEMVEIVEKAIKETRDG